MFIQNVEIKNFRNIKNKSFEFSSRTAIEGKNHKGKTNVLQAIYWVLCDSLLDGSSDYASFIPTNDNRAEVSVKLTIGSHTIEKRYKEHWTKKQGTVDPVYTLTGHDTDYIIDGLKVSTTSEAKFKIQSIIVGSSEQAKELNKYTGIDLYKAMINPFYLNEQIDWKQFRSFIIKLVGNVTNDDVFASDKEKFEKIRDDLSTRSGRTDELSTYYYQREKELNEALQRMNIELGTLDDTPCPTDNDLSAAKAFMERYNHDLLDLRNSHSINPDIANVQNELNKVIEEINSLNASIQEENSQYREEYNQAIDNVRNEIRSMENDYDELTKEINQITYEKKSKLSELEDTQKNIESNNERLQSLREEFSQIKTTPYSGSVPKIICEHCGEVANLSEFSRSVEDFENVQKKRAYDIEVKGKELRNKTDKLKLDCETLNKELAEADYDNKLKNLEDTRKQISNSINFAKQQKADIKLKVSTRSTNELVEKKYQLNNELLSLKANDGNSDIHRIAEYKAKYKDDYEDSQRVIEEDITYTNNQRRAGTIRGQIATLGKDLMENTTKRKILSEFILKKLSMVNESTKTIFPDLEFVLVEKNIREGSFSEVCYVYIKGTKTPFADGSDSEKVLTAIEIIKCLIRFFGIDPLTIIFDGAEKLDTESLAAIDTPAQIITSIVSDKYDEPFEVSIY